MNITCNRCGETKPLTDYHKAFKTKAGEQRYFKFCKSCAAKKAKAYYAANQERMREHSRRKAAERRARNPDEVRRKQYEYRLAKKYGIDSVEFHRIWAAQDGLCLLCDIDLATVKACVDHDHTTGVVRGLLCSTCNQGLGYFHDDPVRLERAAAYLRSVAASTVGEGVTPE